MAHVNPIQIQKFLKGVDYPARKDALIENARKLGADEGVFASLEQLPDEEFETPADVSKAFGELPEEGEGRAPAHQAKPAEKERAARQPVRETGDNEFLVQAHQDTLAEVKLSELALKTSANDKIKDFAQAMVDEHRQMARDIEHLAEKKKLTLPKGVGGEHESSMKSLHKLHGDQFDEAFIEQNIKDHENDIKVFRHYASAAHDADIKDFAKQGEKMLMRHLKLVKDIEKKR